MLLLGTLVGGLEEIGALATEVEPAVLPLASCGSNQCPGLGSYKPHGGRRAGGAPAALICSSGPAPRAAWVCGLGPKNKGWVGSP